MLKTTSIKSVSHEQKHRILFRQRTEQIAPPVRVYFTDVRDSIYGVALNHAYVFYTKKVVEFVPRNVEDIPLLNNKLIM